MKKIFYLISFGFLLISLSVDAQFIVDNTGDQGDAANGDGICDDGSGNCTLRAAIEEANSLAGANTIIFAPPLSGQTIGIDQPLVIIGDGLTINGDIDGNFSPDVIINGGSNGINGLEVNSGNNSIQFLNLVNFSGTDITAIWVSGASAINNTITGCYIGTDLSGLAASPFPNFNGIWITNGASNNLIGDGTLTGRNVIGNNAIGISISDAEDNIIAGNIIGMDAAALNEISNSSSGINLLFASRTIIGGLTPGEMNLISGNDVGGILASASDDIKILGNYIGVDITGNSGVGNGDGIRLYGGCRRAIIGDGTVAGRNVISGNSFEGIELSTANDNLVQGNYIGVGSDGTTDIGNSGVGIFILFNSVGNIIGGDRVTGEGNVISGNNLQGIKIGNGFGNESNNSILGNNIGLDAAGSSSIPNSNHGIWLASGAANNSIGNGTSSGRNLISGNGIHGILVSEGNNLIRGNYIGLGADGSTLLGNNSIGVFLAAGTDNTVGGIITGEGNVIAGNSTGISISTATNNIYGNIIGLDVTATNPRPNLGEGVRITDNGVANNIGDGTPTGANTIAGNNDNGVLLSGVNVNGNAVNFNYIGTNISGASLGNGLAGVRLESGTNGNSIPENIIAYNQTGILATGATTQFNFWTQNSIYSNTTGISIVAGAQGGVVPPVITSVPVDGMVTGTAEPNALVDIYADAVDQGEYFFGVALADASGNWTCTCLGPISSLPAGLNFITATQTDQITSNSSAFSAPFALSTPDPYIVTTNNDSGVGSLRWCIENANTSLSKETISFDIPGSGPWQIDLMSTITIDNPNDVGMEIDGLTQNTSVFGSDMVTLDGSGFTAAGIRINEPNVEIYGLIVTNFSNGIELSTASDAIIGVANRGNVISGNSGTGLLLLSANNALVQGNRIGTAGNGLSGTGNGASGIRAQNSANIQIGGNRLSGEGNLISSNGSGNHYGVQLFSNCSDAKIYGNLIGTDANGNNSLGNRGGIFAGADCDNLNIGGPETGQGNVISGSTANQAIFSSATPANDNMVIENNLIGLSAAGTTPIPNIMTSISLVSSGTTTVSGNVIRGNTIAASGNSYLELIGFPQTNLLIENNQMGTDINGNGGVGLGGNSDGIYFNNVAGTDNGANRIQILDNVIVNSNGNGIELDLSNALLQRNFFGVEADGVTSGANNESGIFIAGGNNNLEIGGVGNENVFAYNSADGITFQGLDQVTSGTVIGVNRFFCNTGDAINFTNFPTVTAPIISSVSSTEITGTSTEADGALIDIYETDLACADNQGAVYIGQTTVTGGAWTFSSAINAGEMYVATVTDLTNGISEFSAPFALPAPTTFITTWVTTDGQITIPTTGGGYNYSISWTNLTNPGDGTDGALSGRTGSTSIFGLTTNDTYQVVISGSFPRIFLNNVFSNAGKIVSIEQWGGIQWQSMADSFTGARNLVINASDSPDLSQVTSLSRMFQSVRTVNAFDNTDLSLWDVSTITDMSYLFYFSWYFNQDISNWDVSNVTTFQYMFAGTITFNQPLETWIFPNATNMSSMFDGTQQFNQPLQAWNVSGVTDMSFMFFEASEFSQPLNGWNVSAVTNMSYMFYDGIFNQPLNLWDVSAVTDMSYMFNFAQAFNQPLDTWDVSNVTDMSGMFEGVATFNQSLGDWDIASVTDMSFMLDNAGISTANYDATLIGWNSLPFLQAGIILGAAGINYCLAETERDNIISNHDWGFNDAGLLCADINGVTPGDYNALVALYNATDGPNWTNSTNWLTAADVSTWFGVVTSGNRVQQVNLGNNNLVGTLPPEIGDLDNTIYFRVNENTISGSIPVETGNMASMIQLWLYDNQLTGTIPVEFGNMTTMRELRIDGNQLTGTIPVELGNLPSLWLFFANTNQLTGNLPITSLNFTSLIALDVNNNSLSGPIPTGITDHPLIDYLLLGNNQFTGAIPAGLSNLADLNYLQLHSNQLTGPIPAELGSLPDLIQLYLYNNQLTGSIPSELGTLADLEQFLLNQNQLSGSIPSELGNLSSVLRFRLHTNQLTGTIPTELGNLSNVTELSLYGNQLDGAIPSEIGNLSNLTSLRLFDNQLSGTIPTSLGNLTNLLDLRVEQNLLSGTIPSEIGNLVNLTDLRFDNNLMTGGIPTEIAKLTLLNVFSISFNSFTDLPDLSALVNMTNMQAHTNNFEFDDLELNAGISGIVYSPQADLVSPGDQTLSTGSTLDLTIQIGGTSNVYQWYKDDIVLPGQTFNNLVIANVTNADEGQYSLNTTNTLVPGLTILSERFLLTVSPVPEEQLNIFAGTDTNGDPISVGQSNVDVGNTVIGIDIDRDFTIQNNESMPVNISSISSSDPAFEIINAPTTVAPGTTELFTVRLVANNVGQFTSNISINSNFAPFNFSVFGEVRADEPALVTVYNAVSPNGDGKHDYLEIQDAELYPEIQVKIINRWGDVVYQASGYDNATIRFEGISNQGGNGELPPGTYFYQIDFKDDTPSQSGFITLRR